MHSMNAISLPDNVPYYEYLYLQSTPMMTVVTMRPVTMTMRKSITATIAHVLLDPDVGTDGTEKVAIGRGRPRK